MDGVLKDFVGDEVAALLALDPALEPLTGAAMNAVFAGGKRMRPTFAYWGWRSVAGPSASQERVLPALAALELLHTFALVHDDIMDGSPTRRGQLTAHRALAADHSTQGLRGDPAHFGVSSAILVGDLCLVWADKLMSRSAVAPHTLLRARAGYDVMRAETIAGQFLDVLGESAREWTLERALRTAQLKTAGYTVTRPLQFGAALGDPAGRAVSAAFERYGQAVGVAFQLRDDLLGLYGDPSATGKPVGEDLAAGKPTVLLELARSLADPAQSAELDKLLSDTENLDVARVSRLIQETGATIRLDQMISQRVAIALEVLDRAPIDACARAPLGRLAAAAAWRNT
ncbi:geranylgeranyl pyrophosphate synthase [Rhizocola hellebori]|uniref:Geranylgeranyl pyrophosphate synthase n=1 Tax=Rhizocola hellebori TaxID=1392758 RepID=A0A8J3VLW5_9ACTN|nr:geranylgeranyl pyrophosphate synthase [Rhizocola hellebori]